MISELKLIRGISVLKIAMRVIACASISCTPLAINADSIQKCQDAEGNWHYGNFAADECSKSEVTKLSSTGTELGTEGPPPTAEELEQEKADKQKKEADAKARKKQIEEDQKLVRVFGSEEVILSTRDRKLESINNNIEVTEQIKAGILEDIEELKARKQTNKVKKMIEEREIAIQSYDQALSSSMAERDKLKQKYSDILRDFRAASQRLASGS